MADSYGPLCDPGTQQFKVPWRSNQKASILIISNQRKKCRSQKRTVAGWTRIHQVYPTKSVDQEDMVYPKHLPAGPGVLEMGTAVRVVIAARQLWMFG